MIIEENNKKNGEDKFLYEGDFLTIPYFFLTYSIGGSSLRKIAAAHQQVKNSAKDEDRDPSRISKVSQSCQAGSCVDYCESCTLAGQAILDAINSIEQVFVENKLISVSTAQR